MNELSRELLPVEALLQRAAGAVVYPATPALAARVLTRIDQQRPLRRLALPAMSLRLAVAVAAAAIVALGAALAVPQSRDAVADFFGFGHVRVEVGPVVGPTPPALSPESFARPAAAGEAQDAVDFPLRFPSEEGERLPPDSVYLQGEAAGLPVAIFVYEGRFDLYETRQGFFGKGGPDPSLTHEIEFGGHPALWIDEGGHIATFLDAQGRLVVESRRTVERGTLLWEEEGVTYRLETALPQADAIAVAESLR